MGKIFWSNNKKEINFKKETPFPNYNNLKDEIEKNCACYVNLKMRDKTLEIYNQSTKEILSLFDELQQINQKQEFTINDLNQQLQKWKEQQNGRKPILSKETKDQIIKWKKTNMSNREIAKILKVSEGTIRNYLKKYDPKNSK